MDDAGATAFPFEATRGDQLYVLGAADPRQGTDRGLPHPEQALPRKGRVLVLFGLLEQLAPTPPVLAAALDPLQPAAVDMQPDAGERATGVRGRPADDTGAVLVGDTRRRRMPVQAAVGAPRVLDEAAPVAGEVLLVQCPGEVRTLGVGQAHPAAAAPS